MKVIVAVCGKGVIFSYKILFRKKSFSYCVGFSKVKIKINFVLIFITKKNTFKFKYLMKYRTSFYYFFSYRTTKSQDNLKKYLQPETKNKKPGKRKKIFLREILNPFKI